MPYYSFATYADVREEWAIRADNFRHARELVRDDPAGPWLEHAFRLDAETVDSRDMFLGEDDKPLIEEITPGHWAWRGAHRDYIDHSRKQNIAAISGDFHTHWLYGEFYERFGKMIDGFVGHYELCIAMAEALTEWEVRNGMAEAYENAGVPWIEVVESFVETVLETATGSGELPDPVELLPRLQVFATRR